MKRIIPTLFPRWSMLIATRLCEHALSLTPNTREGAKLREALTDYFSRRAITHYTSEPDAETNERALKVIRGHHEG